VISPVISVVAVGGNMVHKFITTDKLEFINL